MKRVILIVALLLSWAFLAFPTGVAVGQQAWPAAPTVFSEATFDVTGQPAEFDVIQRVIDFPPGSGTPLHTHSGPQFAVVLAGDLAYRIYGKDDVYKPGKAWMEPTGEQHQGRNTTTGTTRLVATALAPKGVSLTNNLEAQPAGMLPIVVALESTFPVKNQPSDFSVVQRVVDFPPGTGIGPHFHGGMQFVTVIDGQLALQINGTEKIYNAGEHWIEPANVVHSGGNKGTVPTRIMTTALVPKGAAYSTLVQVPTAMPVTGGVPTLVAWSFLLAGVVLLGLGVRSRRAG